MTADEQLQQVWNCFGRADGYEAADEQEIRDLNDPRNRKRGEKTQRARIKRNRQQLERERFTEHNRQEEAPVQGSADAVPVYLLERGELMTQRPACSSGEMSSSGDSDEDGKNARRQERRVNRWSCSGRAQDARWQREQDEARSRRAREAAEWDAAHGAEREAQHAALAAERPDFYWALECEIGRRPKWQLRRGMCLEAGATRVMADDEPLLLYRGFRPFRPDSNVLKAAQVFSGSPDFEWLDAERVRLEARPSEATRPSLPRCVECGQHTCICPGSDAPCRADPFAHGGSADCHFLGAADHERLERQNEYERVMHELLAKARHGPIRLHRDPSGREATDESDRHELDHEREIEEQGRVSAIHGKPWHQVPPGATMPVHWLDSTQDGGPVSRPWEVAERERREREEREERERMERMARAGIPPPRRDDARYGPLAQNPNGDEAFRKDRRAWYEHVTGESFEGVCLTEQWERVDVLARGWRAWGSGRQGIGKGASGPRCVECGCNPCECAPPAPDEEVGYAYDDY